MIWQISDPWIDTRQVIQFRRAAPDSFTERDWVNEIFSSAAVHGANEALNDLDFSDFLFIQFKHPPKI